MTLFTYHKYDSILHNLDPRHKFAMMALISIATLKAMFPALAFVFIVLTFMLHNSGIKPLAGFFHLKYFLILLIFIFISRALTTPGDTLFSIFGISGSIIGIFQGALISFRFLIIILLGMLFSNTTKPSSIKSSAEWFLRPIPLIPEKKASLMIGLSIRFLPLIIEQARQVSHAQKARCSDNLKNPVKKIARLIFPILRKTFQTADNLAISMESRCFSEERTDPEFEKSGLEKLALLLTLLLATLLILF